MEDELLDIIRDIEREKAEKRHFPVHAMFVGEILPAVRRMVESCLNKLVAEKRLGWSRTINDDAFKILDNE